MNDINRVKLFVNDNNKSRDVENIVKNSLIKHNFLIVEDNYELGIAIGGDGSFLRMIRESDFNSDIYYVGVNAGTLGFAQDVSVDEIDNFIEHLRNDTINYESIGVQDIIVETEEDKYQFKSLNEIVIRNDELNTIKYDIYVDDVLLEDYVGDGILVSTSFGSTAYNLSYGGSIVYNTFDTLQITPIAPLNNKNYRCLSNSLIVPSNKRIKIVPRDKNMIITVDGVNLFYNGVLKVETVINNTRIKLIRKSDYNFITKINDKFLR